jgi:hypothetical protein
MVIGDLNAKIGRHETYIDTVRKYSLDYDTNDNGRLTDLAFCNWLLAPRTFLAKTYTWDFPRCDNTQIDHVLIQRRNTSSIIDVRTCREANCGSDHQVKAAYRCRIMVQRKKVSEKGTKNRCGEIKDSNGRIIADSKGIKQRWKEYVQELINWSGGIDDN